MCAYSRNNRRIIKNTAMLYIRMLFVMFISLYISRVILKVLGVEDFGIYNVVGGIVALFSFLNSAMSGATSRFIAFELGKEDIDRVNKTFNTAFIIHLGIAIIVFLIAETVGLWFLDNILNIPIDRFPSAKIVYQFSIFACVVNIIQIPFSAYIIAHEKMNIYACISIFDVLLKLFILYLLKCTNGDKLIIYSVLIFIVSVIVACLYCFYCKYKLENCYFRFCYNKNIMKSLLFYSGWNLYGTMCMIVNVQGLNMLINIFFGPVLNASWSIANQVQTGVLSFTGSFMMAVYPQIVKSYANKDFDYLIKIIVNTTKYTYLLLLCVSLPILVDAEFILKIWLSNVPKYAIDYSRFSILICLVLTLFSSVLTIGINATGKIKNLSLVRGSIILLSVPLSYLFLTFYKKEIIPPLINLSIQLFAGFYTIYLLKLYISKFCVLDFVKNVVFVCCVISLFSFGVIYLIYSNMPMGWPRFIVIFIANVSVVIGITYLFVIDNAIKVKINEKLKHILYG